MQDSVEYAFPEVAHLSVLAHSMEQLLATSRASSHPLAWAHGPARDLIPNSVPVNIHVAVLERLCRSIQAEELITPVLTAHRPQGAHLDRPQHRIKSPHSIADKVSHRLARWDMAPTLDNCRIVVNGLDDIIRYCYVAPDNASLVPLVLSSEHSLEMAGHRCRKAKSAFLEGSSYRGIITGWATPENDPYEVQYHTPSSAALNEEAHILYRRIRNTGLPMGERQAAIDHCIQLFSTVPMPPGVEDLQTLGGVPLAPYEGLRF